MNKDTQQKVLDKSLNLSPTLDMHQTLFMHLPPLLCLLFFTVSLFLTVSCSALTQYSISNTVPTELKGETDSNETVEQTQVTFSKVINRTPFPSLTFVMEQRSKEMGFKCQNYILELSLTHPLILDPNSVLGQSHLELKVVKSDLILETVFVGRELLTFSLTQGVNEESLLQSALIRLLDRVMLWCIPQD